MHGLQLYITRSATESEYHTVRWRNYVELMSKGTIKESIAKVEGIQVSTTRRGGKELLDLAPEGRSPDVT